MIQINKRNIFICVILTILTLGIYGIYWKYLIIKNIKKLETKEDNCAKELLCLIFVPLYPLFWWSTRGEKLKKKFGEYECSATGNGTMYLILSLVGLEVLAMALMQNDFNSLKGNVQAKQGDLEEVLVWLIGALYTVLAVVLWLMSTRYDEAVYTLIGCIVLVPGVLLMWASSSAQNDTYN